MGRFAILFILITVIIPRGISAQTNGSFESGLTGWLTTGNVTIDSLHAQEGKRCAKIDIHSSLMQRMEVRPFSILQFDLYIKCSSVETKAYFFARFYDAADHELLSYKSSAISAVSYQQTGNYTEAPPYTKYVTIGIERDSAATGYVYADNCIVTLNIGTPAKTHQPLCDIDQYMRPFWNTDTIYNETVLMYAVNGQAATGRLFFTPAKIISVKSFDLGTVYTKDADYSMNGNTITRTARSKMFFRADTSFDRKNNLAWYNLQSQWVVVTYIHKDMWSGPVPSYKGDKMPVVMAKLRSRSPLIVAAYGMSITRGLDVSSYDTVAPYMPTYIDLFTYELKKMYGYDDITTYNAGLPGALVSWGAEYAGNYINPVKPDLVIVDFGMNDFWRYTPAQFKEYIQTIIRTVKTGNPQAEFLLLSNIKFDPGYILDSDKNKNFYVTNMTGYNSALQQLETTGIIDLDMTTISDAIYHRKKAKDCLTNPLHPNDYLARWYAQCMAALFRL